MSSLQQKHALLIYGWIREYVEKEAESLTVLDELKGLILLFYDTLIRFDDKTMTGNWRIKSGSDNLIAINDVNGFQASNIYSDVIIKPNTGKYEWNIKLNECDGNKADVVIGIIIKDAIHSEVKKKFYMMGYKPGHYLSKYVKQGDIIHVYVDTHQNTIQFEENNAIANPIVEDTEYVFAFTVNSICKVEIV